MNLTTMKKNLKKQAVAHTSMVYRDKEWLLLEERLILHDQVGYISIAPNSIVSKPSGKHIKLSTHAHKDLFPKCGLIHSCVWWNYDILGMISSDKESYLLWQLRDIMHYQRKFHPVRNTWRDLKSFKFSFLDHFKIWQ